MHSKGAELARGDLAGLRQRHPRAGAGAAVLRALAICWPTAFMNIALLLTFIVPKSAHGSPLIAVSASGPCVVLTPSSVPITVAKSPDAEANEGHRAPSPPPSGWA